MNKYLLIIILLSLMSFSLKKDLDYTRLVKIEDHYYSHNMIQNTDYNFYYNQNRLDSIVSILSKNKHDDWPKKDVFIFKYYSNTVESFKKNDLNGNISKSHYDFDSRGRLSRFIQYSFNEVRHDYKYFYSKRNKLIKVTSINKSEIDDFTSIKESTYYLNDSFNIDTIYEFDIIKNKKKLNTIKVFKYDTKPNPYKNLLFLFIDERYFNSNNIVSCQYLNNNRTVRFTRKNNFSYDTEGKLIRNFDNDIFETDSIVHIYQYK